MNSSRGGQARWTGIWFPADNPIHPSAVEINCGGHLIKTNWVMTCNWMEWPTETTQIDGQSVVDKAATIDDGVHCCRIYMEGLSRCHGFTIERSLPISFSVRLMVLFCMQISAALIYWAQVTVHLFHHGQSSRQQEQSEWSWRVTDCCRTSNRVVVIIKLSWTKLNDKSYDHINELISLGPLKLGRTSFFLRSTITFRLSLLVYKHILLKEVICLKFKWYHDR